MDVYIRKIEKEKADVDECARLIEAARRFDPSVAHNYQTTDTYAQIAEI